MRLAEKLTGIKAVQGIDPVLTLLVELQTQRLIVEWIDGIISDFDSGDLLADPVSVGFGANSVVVHTPRELLDIAHRWHKSYADLNAQVVKLGLKSRQLDQSREQAQLVYGIFQSVLADPALGIPQSIRTVLRTALGERLRGVGDPGSTVTAQGGLLALESR